MKATYFGRKNSISRRLLVAVILMSTAMTILTSAYQLNGNYQRYVSDIHSRFDEIKKVHLKNLSDRLWTADIDALNSNMKEISILPDIQYMEIKENGEVISRNGSQKKKNTITKIFPIFHLHKGKPVKIGALTVQATLDNAYQQVLNQILDIVTSNAVKTFFLAGFILFIFNHLITRHLETMAEYAENLDISKLDSKLKLDRKINPNKQADEIEILVNAFSAMQNNLAKSISKLKDSESHYKQLVETTTAIPWELDLSNWQFTYVGPQAEQVLGFPVSDWYKDKFWQSQIHPDDREAAENFCLRSSAKGKDYNFEYRMITSDGRIIWIFDDVKIIYKNDIPVALQGYMFDITARKETELELDQHRHHLEKLVNERTTELLAINKELESFAYSVSHDLRAPLRGIDGFSQILIEDNADKLDETSIEYLQRIRKSAQLMGQIINDLLLLSRVTRQELEIKTINISKAAQQSIDRLQSQTDRNVKVTIEEDLIAEADENLVPIVIENLVGNAWKYTQKEPQACIDIGKEKIKGRSYFYVKDNGIGFKMEYVEKIFQPFQRLHSQDQFDGTGIGLATVARAIQRQGGDIITESSPDNGATFYFRFS